MEIRPILSETDLQEKIGILADRINRDLEGKEVVVVGVLKGAFLFMADLVRQLKMPVTCDFLRMSSYEGKRSSGGVRLEFDLTQPVAGQTVLLVEDIVDTGLTVEVLLAHLKEKGPAEVRICALLHKKGMSPSIPIDYLGFEIPNVYVVGYGLDLDGQYRNLPFIGKVEE